MKVIYYISYCIAILSICSCKKFLDVKPSTASATVATIEDAQSLLDNNNVMNLNMPFYGEWSGDNVYFSKTLFDAYGFSSNAMGSVYLWGQYPFLGSSGSNSSWALAYASIMYANTAIDALDKITVSNADRSAANNAKGCALAFRGYYFWKLAVAFAKAYNSKTASVDLGIPLRTNININEKSKRASVDETYKQIIKDLSSAVPLLPIKSTAITRPSKPAVYAMLSEVYLSMRDYQKSQLYADSSLSLAHELIDYNLLDKTSSASIPVDGNNKEVLIALASNGNPWFPGQGSCIIDSTLLASYKFNDLRKRFFYSDNGDGTFYFSGTYSSFTFFFVGPSVDEMYLTRAECLARSGRTLEAMADLNELMAKRLDKSTGPYKPYVANSSNEALTIILQERRKELAFRDLRWMDIKRLNLEGYNIVLTRNMAGTIFKLEPNDNRYAIQLPTDVIQITGMPQNPF